MIKLFKLKNNKYISSESVIHDKKKLSDLLDKYEIETGIITVTSTTKDALEDINVNFKKEFSKVPVIFLTNAGSLGYTSKIGYDQATKKGFRFRYVHTTANTTCWYSYLAIANK